MELQFFYRFLNQLPNTSGISIYFIETDQPDISWNSAKKCIEKLCDTHTGYRKYSLCTVRDLTIQETEDMEYMVLHNYFIISEYFMYQNKRVILLNGFNLQGVNNE